MPKKTPNKIYESRTLKQKPKRKRRTNREIQVLDDAIKAVLESDWPMTIRQIYYQLVSRGDVPKTEQGYKASVRRLKWLRKNQEIPYGWITDNTRLQRKPRSYSSIHHALSNTREFYRRDLWENQNVHVEIWLEKDALSGVLLPITSEWDVPLMITRGYSSITFLHSAGEELSECGKPCYIYYFGDRDPSGRNISKVVEAGLREFSGDAEIHFQIMAVTDEQIARYNLPTRPTKKTDSRSKSFDGDSVEVDAIPASILRSICQDCITRHIDQDELERLRTIEEAEKQSIRLPNHRGGVEGRWWALE